MKAEYLIGLECLAFLIGYFIRDIGSLGAVPPGERDWADGRQPRTPAAPKKVRQPW